MLGPIRQTIGTGVARSSSCGDLCTCLCQGGINRTRLVLCLTNAVAGRHRLMRALNTSQELLSSS